MGPFRTSALLQGRDKGRPSCSNDRKKEWLADNVGIFDSIVLPLVKALWAEVGGRTHSEKNLASTE